MEPRNIFSPAHEHSTPTGPQQFCQLCRKGYNGPPTWTVSEYIKQPTRSLPLRCVEGTRHVLWQSALRTFLRLQTKTSPRGQRLYDKDTLLFPLYPEPDTSVMFLEICQLSEQSPRPGASSGRGDVGSDQNPPQISTNTGSKLAMHRAKEWLQRCMDSHTKCNTTGPSFMPSRILDIGTPNDPTALTIRLCEPAGSERYVCLSHCWGNESEHPLKTLHSNIEAHRRGIAVSTLPRSFQDTVSVVRSLGLRFLWIDSICIIQDDEGDKAKEISVMCSIYERSTLTISITRACNASEGCFATPSLDHIGYPFRSPSDKHEYDIAVRRKLPHSYRWASTASSYDVEGMPLLKRAWCLQERLLSPRVLHFGPHELFWECREMTTCECRQFHHSPFGHNNTDGDGEFYFPGPVEPRNVAEYQKAWWTLVETYSTLGLTSETDKLAAIQGLGAYFASRLGDQYAVGIWMSNLIPSLLWSVNTIDGRLPTRRLTNRSPTWSWACVGAHVSYNYTKLIIDPGCKLELVDSVPWHLQALARSNHCLRGAGWLTRSHCIYNSYYPDRYDWTIRGMGQTTFSPDIHVLENTVLDILKIGSWERSTESTIFLVLRQLKPNEPVSERVGKLSWNPQGLPSKDFYRYHDLDKDLVYLQDFLIL